MVPDHKQGTVTQCSCYFYLEMKRLNYESYVSYVFGSGGCAYGNKMDVDRWRYWMVCGWGPSPFCLKALDSIKISLFVFFVPNVWRLLLNVKLPTEGYI